MINAIRIKADSPDFSGAGFCQKNRDSGPIPSLRIGVKYNDKPCVNARKAIQNALTAQSWEPERPSISLRDEISFPMELEFYQVISTSSAGIQLFLYLPIPFSF
jgi:hypothetical protein